MANLLPPKYQKTIRRSMRARFIMIGATAATAVAAVALLALVPSYLTVRFSIPASEKRATSASSTSEVDRAQIAEAQSMASVLAPFLAASTTPTEAVRLALAGKPAGISLDNITYAGGRSGTSGQIIISGTARSPELIRTYQDALTKDTHFKSATVPVGALVGSKDGHFTLTLIGQF